MRLREYASRETRNGELPCNGQRPRCYSRRDADRCQRSHKLGFRHGKSSQLVVCKTGSNDSSRFRNRIREVRCTPPMLDVASSGGWLLSRIVSLAARKPEVILLAVR